LLSGSRTFPEAAAGDIWLKDLESRKETALTSTSADEFGPEILPDGNSVGYQLIENGRWDYFLLPIGSDGQPLEIYHSHSARRSLLNAEIIPLELHVAPGRLLFHLGEITGNIWMVEWKAR
jgi:hypothetical protein